MFKLASLVLVALSAVAVVNGAAVFPRTQPPPAGWIAEILEPYDAYHTRYLAIRCQEKHNTQFFDDCCHPMKKGETLEKNRKAYCRPGANPDPSSTPPAIRSLVAKPSSSPAPEPTSVPDQGDDCEDDDDDDEDDDDDQDCEDEPVSSPAPSYTPTPTLIPSETPKPTLTPSETPKPTPTPSPSPASPSPVKSSSKEPEPSPASSLETHTGGFATFYTQNGNYGACGEKHSDDDLIAALDYRTYGDLSAKSKYCGKMIKVSWQGKSVNVRVEDACPSCNNAASVDLSKAAFRQLADEIVGELSGITWELLS